MVELVLAIRTPEAEPTEHLHDLGMDVVDAELVEDLLGSLDHRLVDLLDRLLDYFLDTARVDTAILDQSLQRDPSHFAAHRVEPRQHDRFRRVVDDHVDPGGLLERSNVPALAADDAPLHLVRGELNHGNRGHRGLLRGHALNGQSDDLLGFPLAGALGLVLNFPDGVGGHGPGLVLEVFDELRAGLLGAHPGQALESLPRLFHEAVDLGDAPAQVGLATFHFLGAPLLRELALVQRIELAVERLGALDQSSLESLRFLAALGLFLLPGVAEAHRLLFALEFPGAPDILGLIPGTLPYRRGVVLGGGLVALALCPLPALCQEGTYESADGQTQNRR